MIEHNPVLFAEVATVNPGLVSTLSALEGQLKHGPLPEPTALHAYGQYLCRLGAAVIGHADALASPPIITAIE